MQTDMWKFFVINNSDYYHSNINGDIINFEDVLTRSEAEEYSEYYGQIMRLFKIKDDDADRLKNSPLLS